MEKKPQLSSESTRDKEKYDITQILYREDYFSEQSRESFRQIINSYATEFQLEESLSVDVFVSLLDLYINTSSDRDPGATMEKVVGILKGTIVTELYDIEETVEAILSVTRVIAENLYNPNVLSANPAAFSLDRTEELRAQINAYAGESVFTVPFYEEEVWALIDMYARTHFKQHLAPRQTAKLIGVLQGRSIKDIAEEFGVKSHTISDMWRKAVSNIAYEFVRNNSQPELQSLMATEQSARVFLHETGLSEAHSIILKKHLGGLRSSLSAEEIMINVEICSMIQEEIIKRMAYVRMVGVETDLPKAEHSQLTLKLLGNKRNGVAPISRKNILKQYHTQLSRRSESSRDIDSKVLAYSRQIDTALLEIAQWMELWQ